MKGACRSFKAVVVRCCFESSTLIDDGEIFMHDYSTSSRIDQPSHQHKQKNCNHEFSLPVNPNQMKHLFTPTNRLLSQLPSFAALLTSIMSSAGSAATPSSHFTPITNPLPRTLYGPSIALKPTDLRRMDESSDADFYSSPRFVQHIDGNCIARLMSYYEAQMRRAAAEKAAKSGEARDRTAGPQELAAANLSVLDLCSSWTSHLSPSLLPGTPGSVLKTCIGYGMNKAELAANKHLTSFVVRDLNTSPDLSEVPDNSIDVAICSVSIDYLTRPVEVLGEVRRVLRDGGSMHASFSNRCFPTKVVGKWLEMSDAERRRWVGGYFWVENEAGGRKGTGSWADVEEVVLNEGGYDDPLFVVRARKVVGETSRKSEL